jgi:hypothetical protein
MISCAKDQIPGVKIEGCPATGVFYDLTVDLTPLL